jgi:hypothetical protein
VNQSAEEVKGNLEPKNAKIFKLIDMEISYSSLTYQTLSTRARNISSEYQNVVSKAPNRNE